MTLFFQCFIFSKLITGDLKSIPANEASFESSITFAACKKAFEGMQPTFKQTPPKTLFLSIKATLKPRSAALKAAVYPPGPAPITTKS